MQSYLYFHTQEYLCNTSPGLRVVSLMLNKDLLSSGRKGLPWALMLTSSFPIFVFCFFRYFSSSVICAMIGAISNSQVRAFSLLDIPHKPPSLFNILFTCSPSWSTPMPVKGIFDFCNGEISFAQILLYFRIICFHLLHICQIYGHGPSIIQTIIWNKILY